MVVVSLVVVVASDYELKIRVTHSEPVFSPGELLGSGPATRWSAVSHFDQLAGRQRYSWRCQRPGLMAIAAVTISD